MTGIGYTSSRTQLSHPVRRMGACLVFLLLWPIGLMGQQDGQVELYTQDGVQTRSYNAPTVVDVGLPTPVDIPSAVTGTGQGTRLTEVEFVVREGEGGRVAKGIPHNVIGGGIAEDLAGNLWVATSGGLSRFDGQTWTTFDQEDGLSSRGSGIWDVDVDQQGHVWVSDGVGISRFDGQRWRHYKGMSNGMHMAAAPNGDMWFVVSQQLYRFDGEDWWIYGYDDGIPDRAHIHQIIVDRAGTIWMDFIIHDLDREAEPDWYSLISFDGRQWMAYRLHGGGPKNFFVDRRNRLWTGSNEGLYVRENQTWRLYERDGRRWVGYISMAEDEAGKFWIRNGNEFGWLEGTTWTYFPWEEFRPGVLLMDSQGNLWITSRNGLLKWASRDLPTHIEGQSDATEPRSFNLMQNYPNPFNRATRIGFHLGKRVDLSLQVFNATGQSVATLMAGVYPAGAYQTHWDGRDDQGQAVASGLYVYRLNTNSWESNRKMVLVK